MCLRPLNLGRVLKATYVDRPNRFLVRCKLPGTGVVNAHMPNPGRMWELLLPGVALYLTQARAERKTPYTVVAVERDGEPIFLHTHLTNAVARDLIQRKLVPGLKRSKVVRGEVTAGKSRFDLLLEQGGQPLYVEVKSCTLFGNRVAMFPDAITARGRKHLLHLADMSDAGVRTAVLFLVQTQRVDWFMPDYHTDVEFSQAMLDVRGRVRILPVSIGWRPDLSLAPDVRLLKIPWGRVTREAQDRGAYLIMLRLDRPKTIEVGKLGRLRFAKGYHVYVGSAMRNLAARVERHRRLRKRMRWHIDYLRQAADGFVAAPIRSSKREECDLARALSQIMPPGPTGFGSSDCECPAHLFYSPSNPLDSPAFHDVLQAFRMRAPS